MSAPCTLPDRFVTCIALVLLLWEKRVFYATWTPFTWLVGYSDPHKPGGDALYGECAVWSQNSGFDEAS